MYQETIFQPQTPLSSIGYITWREPVPTFTDLSTVGTPSLTPPPTPGEARVVLDEDIAYIYDDTSDSWVTIGGPKTHFVQAFAPPSVNGHLWSNTTNGSLFQYDSVRGKWLGMEERKISGARDSIATTNIFLRMFDGVPTNLTTETIDWDATLVRLIALNSAGIIETWTGEVYDDGVLIASVSVVAGDFAIDNTLNINVTANSRISVRCNGTNIDRPRVDAVFRRRA
jgi:hypothetical protein